MNYISNLKKSYSFNKVINVLIVSDFLVWSAANMVIIIFPVFVIDKIKGGSLEVAGIASMIYLIISSIVTLPFGRIMDRIRGHIDEFHFLLWGTIIRAIALLFFVWIISVWQLYVLQFVLGLTKAAIFPSWRILFNKYIDKGKEALEWSAYDSFVSIGMGIGAYVGGIVGGKNYRIAFVVVSIITLCGGLLLFILRSRIKNRTIPG